MLGYREHEVGETRGEWLGRVHADDRAPLTQALDAYLAGADRRALRVRAPDPAPRRQLPLDARARDRGPRRQRPRDPRSSAASPTSPTAARPSTACSTTRCTTRSPACPNRVLFVDRLDQSIRRAQRHHPECCAAVLFLDLDRFKVINDSLGHACGDQLLQAVARRLEAALRPNDTVARLSGDEFTLLLDDVCEAREATSSPSASCSSLQAPFLLDGRELFIGASIGIALATAQSEPGAGDARRRRRDVPREGRRQGPPRGLRRRDARAGHAPARPGGRAAQRDRERHARGRLPADRAGRDGPHRRLRGARPLAARRAGGGPGDGRGDRAGRSRSAARSCATACAQLARVARAAARRGPDRRRQRLGAPARRARTSSRCCSATLRETGLDPRALRLEVSEHDLSRGRADEATRRVLEQALEQARRAHAHRPLRHGRVAAAAAAPLPRRRDQDLTRAGDRDRPRRGRVRDRARGRRPGAQPRARGDRRGRREARAARLPEGARLRVRAGLPHLRDAQRRGGAGAAGVSSARAPPRV